MRTIRYQFLKYFFLMPTSIIIVCATPFATLSQDIYTHTRPIEQDYYTIQSKNLMHLQEMVETVHMNNAMPWIMKKGYAYAKQELDYTLLTFPNHPEALQLLWVYAKASKKPSDAIPFFEKAIGLYPQYGETYYLYGAFLTDFGLYKEGIKKLEMALTIEPKMAVAQALLAKAHNKAGNAKEAVESAHKATELGYKGNLLEGILKE